MQRMVWITGALALSLCLRASAAEPLQREAWVADFERMKAFLTTNYPNLEWQARRGVDLQNLEREARERIAVAKDAAGARAAFARMLYPLGDGHVRLRFNAMSGFEPIDGATPECERYGYPVGLDTDAMEPELPGYEALSPPDAYISAGTITVGNIKVGVLRIPGFLATRAMCEEFVRERDRTKGPHLLGIDTNPEAERAGSRLFLAQVERGVAAIVATRPAALLVDIMGNSGGSQLSIAVARIVAGEDLATAPMWFPRTRYADIYLDEAANFFRDAIKRASKPERAFLQPIAAQIERARIQAKQPCDLSPLWENQQVNCTNLFTGPFFGGGFVAHELPAAWIGKPWARIVSATSGYGIHKRMWAGPVIVIVDQDSASAAAEFAAVLQDSGRGFIVGAPTADAGCGWVMDKSYSALYLENTSARLQLPDCANLRPDGTNEVTGVQPDLLIGLGAYDTPAERARRVLTAMPEALRRAVK